MPRPTWAVTRAISEDAHGSPAFATSSVLLKVRRSLGSPVDMLEAPGLHCPLPNQDPGACAPRNGTPGPASLMLHAQASFHYWVPEMCDHQKPPVQWSKQVSGRSARETWRWGPQTLL